MALSGPRLMPKSGKATHLVVLCHGYGADGKDLIGLAPHWQRILPSAAFVAPNASQVCPGAGYQWFPIARLDPQEMHKGVESASPLLEAFVMAELQDLGLSADRLALVGFSQGTMMSLHIGLRSVVRPAAIVGFSGLLTGLPPQAANGSPPVFLAHGAADPLIPIEALFMTASALGATGHSVQWHVSPGLEHGIDEVGLEIAGGFLLQAFRGQLSTSGKVGCPLA